MAWWKYAYVGQKVEAVPSGDGQFIDDIFDEGSDAFPETGKIYTIAEIIDVAKDSGAIFEWNSGCQIGFSFVELHPDEFYCATQFRPVVDDKRIAARVAEIKRLATSPVKQSETA